MITTDAVQAAGVALAAEIVGDEAGLAGPIGQARVLPAGAYHDPGLWALESEAIFGREWLYVGHVSQVPRPGTVLRRTVAGEPVLLARDDDGQVRVLSAMCQHRAHPLLDGLGAPDGAECVAARRMTCPYHGWSYALDGRLVAAPFMNETTPVAELRRTVRLPEIRSETFHGFVFINFDPAAAPLGPTLARLDHELEAFRAVDVVASPPVTRTGLAFNWKSAFENALEPYHTDFVHKGSHDAAPASGSGFFDFAPGDGQILTWTRFAEGNGELFSTDGSPVLPEFTGLSEDQRGRLLFAAVPPTFFAVISPGSILVNNISSCGPESTDIESVLFHPRAAARTPGFEKLRDEELGALEVIQDQDAMTQRTVQRALHARLAPRGPLSWLETTLPQFNAWLIPRYRAGVAGHPAGNPPPAPAASGEVAR
jgi:phenylpropionate dioxygenase-like ring-hydroxylating dioxygenase large terminal subunit